jgi:SAM-dependent methyltransferase
MRSKSASSDKSRVNFETEGPTWGERASRGELSAVFSPDGADRRNLFCHTQSLYAADRALALTPERGVLLDFGCGTGRMLRYFGAHGWSVVGTEITPEMIDEARRHGLPKGASVHQTDGVAIPLPDASVDMVWVCGVLKYTLFEPGAICRGGTGRSSSGKQGGLAEDEKPFAPVYRDVAREMYRVLRPGGWVVNNEVYVDAPPEAFTRDFEDIGFVTREVHVLQRYYEPFAKFLQSPYVPRWLVAALARLYAARRFHFDDPRRPVQGLRDYMFVWSKPTP